MPEITYEDLAAGLRARTDLPERQAAAVGLLLWHESWLRRPDFRRACIAPGGPPVGIYWPWVRDYYDREPPHASTSQMTVLEIALALAEDQFGFSGLGQVHRYRVAEAFAAALGQALAGPPPVPHTHPPFIPADGPCPACDAPAADVPPEVVTAAIARTSGPGAADIWAMAGGTTVGGLLARKELITSAVLAAAPHFDHEIDRQALAAIEEATTAERARIAAQLAVRWPGMSPDEIAELIAPPEDEAI